MGPTKHKLITCILPKDVAVPLTKTLRDDRGILAANFNFARGMGRITPLAYRGVGEQSEKEVVNVVVTADQADEMFEFIFREAHIDRPHGGMIYMTPLTQTTEYTLPEIPTEE
ncbi:MAG: hypothetical protein DRQ37_03035 [Gammaproteobacteria bacterium]|nr:MAG: hypothetical protein DRQ37_03035 [Gammaproteobacteria bacterium]